MSDGRAPSSGYYGATAALASMASAGAGGEPAGGEALRILAGAELEPPATLELLDVLRSDSYLFLRYGVWAG